MASSCQIEGGWPGLERAGTTLGREAPVSAARRTETTLWVRFHKIVEAELRVSKEVFPETGYTPGGWVLRFILDANGPHPPISLLLQCLD